MEYYSALKKKETLPFATTQMSPPAQDIMLSEKGQTQKESIFFLREREMVSV
jgi:hypothetical protein